MKAKARIKLQKPEIFRSSDHAEVLTAEKMGKVSTNFRTLFHACADDFKVHGVEFYRTTDTEAVKNSTISTVAHEVQRAGGYDFVAGIVPITEKFRSSRDSLDSAEGIEAKSVLEENASFLRDIVGYFASLGMTKELAVAFWRCIIQEKKAEDGSYYPTFGLGGRLGGQILLLFKKGDISAVSLVGGREEKVRYDTATGKAIFNSTILLKSTLYNEDLSPDQLSVVGSVTFTISLEEAGDGFILSLEEFEVKLEDEKIELNFEDQFFLADQNISRVVLTEDSLVVGTVKYPIPLKNRAVITEALGQLIDVLSYETLRNLAGFLSRCDAAIAQMLAGILTKNTAITAANLMHILPRCEAEQVGGFLRVLSQCDGETTENLLGVLAECDGATIRNLTDVLTKLDEENSASLINILLQCNARTAGVLGDILAFFNGAPEQQVRAIRAVAADFQKSQTGFKLSDGFRSIRAAVEGGSQQKPFAPLVENLGRGRALLPDDKIEMALYLFRYNQEPKRTLQDVASSLDRVSDAEQRKFAAFILLTEDDERIKSAIARSLVNGDVATNALLVKLIASQLEYTVATPSNSPPLQLVKFMATGTPPVSPTSLSGILFGVASIQLRELLRSRLKFCGCKNRDELIKLLALNGVTKITQENTMFVNILLQSSKEDVKVVAAAAVKYGEGFIRFVNLVVRGQPRDDISPWLIFTLNIFGARYNEQQVKDRLESFVALFGKFGSLKIRLDGEQEPCSIARVAWKHESPRSFANVLIDLKVVGAEINDALVNCVFKMSGEVLGKIVADEVKRYNKLFSSASPITIGFDRFFENMSPCSELQRGFIFAVLEAVQKLFKSLKITGTPIDLSEFMERLVKLDQSQLGCMMAIINGFNSQPDLLNQLKSSQPRNTVLALLSYISGSAYKSDSVIEVIDFLKKHPTSLTAETFQKLDKVSIEDVVAAIEQTESPVAETAGIFGGEIFELLSSEAAEKAEELVNEIRSSTPVVQNAEVFAATPSSDARTLGKLSATSLAISPEDAECLRSGTPPFPLAPKTSQVGEGKPVVEEKAGEVRDSPEV